MTANGESMNGVSAHEPETSVAVDELEALHDRLDALWTKYLNLLDHYQKAQNQLATHLSSAFFSLAQANFKSNTRTRYGKDYFDARMQATRRVNVGSDGDDTLSLVITSVNLGCTGKDGADCKDRADYKDGAYCKDEAGGESELPTPRSTPVPPTHAVDDRLASKNEAQGRNPLHWFGILVPRELRSAQSASTQAMSEPVTDAINASRRLRDVEMEIRKVRKTVRRAEKAQQ